MTRRPDRKFVPRVTVWHHKVLPSDAKGTEFSILAKHTFDSFSCIPFDIFILKEAFITTYNDVDLGNLLK